jgi:asparaginyl-tRNA synthetase
MVLGVLAFNRENLEIVAQEVTIVSKSARLLYPEIRKLDTDILAHHNTDKVLASRHLYLRNPLIMALNLYRSRFMSTIHQWFADHQFVDITAPLITPSILYEPNSAIHISNLKTNKALYLSQCAGFYLEAAAHAHERVYNLGPSFRNESRTNRHLMEYWHIKAELCSGQMNDITDLVEIFLRDVSEAMSTHTDKLTAMMGTSRPRIQIPFQRITYREALDILESKELTISFGQNVSKRAEELLTDHFGGPVWITHKPRELEPFPYSICPDDDQLTMTADLISSDGFGEICGVAEKSFTREELELRMKEKGKAEMTDIYGWVLESRDFGMVPHTAFGIGFERVSRWFCGVPHVKDMIPFPRIFGRDPLP